MGVGDAGDGDRKLSWWWSVRRAAEGEEDVVQEVDEGIHWVEQNEVER